MRMRTIRIRCGLESHERGRGKVIKRWRNIRIAIRAYDGYASSEFTELVQKRIHRYYKGWALVGYCEDLPRPGGLI